MKKINVLHLIFSIFLSISLYLKIVIDKNLDYFINKFHIDMLFIVEVTLLTCLIYYLLDKLFYLIDKIPLKKSKLVLNRKKIFLIFLAILTMGISYLIVYYPAVYLNDTLFMMYNPLTRGHPIIYGVFMSITFFALKALFTPTITVLIMSIIQAIIASIILTYVIIWFNKKVNNKILTILLICYYVFLLIIACYNVALNKDTPFALAILLLFVFIYEIIESKGKILTNKRFLINLFIVSAVAISVRNNGIYVILLSLIIVFSAYGKKYKKQCLSFLSLIIIFLFIPAIVSKTLNAQQLKREMYAVPIQQISYLVKYHPNRLSKKDYQLLEKFIDNPKKNLANNYEVFSVDRVKYDNSFKDKKFNKYSKKFLLLWISKFPKNISSYTKSYLLNTYHLWSINKLDKSQSTFFSTSFIGAEVSKHIYHEELFPKDIQGKLTHFYYVYCSYLNPAACFFLLLIINLYARKHKKKEIIILSVPLITLWLTLMIASPYSSALRYMSPYIYILPILLLYTFKITRKGVKNGLSRKSKK